VLHSRIRLTRSIAWRDDWGDGGHAAAASANDDDDDDDVDIADEDAEEENVDDIRAARHLFIIRLFNL